MNKLIIVILVVVFLLFIFAYKVGAENASWRVNSVWDNVFKFQDGNVNCYVISGEGSGISCVKVK